MIKAARLRRGRSQDGGAGDARHGLQDRVGEQAVHRHRHHAAGPGRPGAARRRGRPVHSGRAASWSGITVRHLLSHTSGSRARAPGWTPCVAQRRRGSSARRTPVPLRFVPGTKWEYSNLGYTVLVEIIARGVGTAVARVHDRARLPPAGLLATRTTTTTEPVPNRASGYRDNDRLLDARGLGRGAAGRRVPVDGAAIWRAGTPCSTASSILCARPAVARCGRRRTLADGTQRALRRSAGSSTVPARAAQVWHSGGLPGFKSQLHRYLDDGVTVIVLIRPRRRRRRQHRAPACAELYLPTK